MRIYPISSVSVRGPIAITTNASTGIIVAGVIGGGVVGFFAGRKWPRAMTTIYGTLLGAGLGGGVTALLVR